MDANPRSRSMRIAVHAACESLFTIDANMQQQQDKVIFFLFQVPLRLPSNVRYICDFVVFWADGSVTFEDVKGYRTDVYKAKKKIVEAIYPIVIIER